MGNVHITFAVLFLALLVGCGGTSVGPETDLARQAHEAGFSVSENIVTLKPLVLCARDGLGERIVIVATEVIIDHPDSNILNPVPLIYSNITGTGDFTRTVYQAQPIEFTGQQPGQPIPQGARTATVRLRFTNVAHTFTCDVTVRWLLDAESRVEVLQRFVDVNCG